MSARQPHPTAPARPAAAEVLPTDYTGQTYYGLPATKPPTYGWLIAAYFFVGGLAAACQIIATIADFFDPDEAGPAVRAGRYLALAGAVMSPVLLIADLHTPQRWYNMLRLYRSTSAMSIGSWVLSIFGALTGLVAVGQALQDVFGWRLGRSLARLASVPASAAAAMVAVYTGALLESTNMPLWTAPAPHISTLFAGSAVSTGVAAIRLLTPRARQRLHRRLDWLASAAGLLELADCVTIERRWQQQQVAAPVRRPPLAIAWYGGTIGLGVLAPLVIHLAGLFGPRRARRSARRASRWTAALMLAGGFLLRAVFVFGGRQSGRRPHDYFGVTQFPGSSPNGKRRRSE